MDYHKDWYIFWGQVTLIETNDIMRNKRYSKTIRSFIERNRNLLLICGFLNIPFSIVACVAYYSLRESEYSFGALIVGTPIAFIILFWVLWFILKYIFAEETISYFQTNIIYWTFKMLVIVFILWRVIPGFNFFIFHPPSYSYDIKIKLSKENNESICIWELNNLGGIIDAENETVGDFVITGGWEKDINDCSYFIGENNTGAIKFTNIGVFSDKITLNLPKKFDAAQLEIRVTDSQYNLIDRNYRLSNDQTNVIKNKRVGEINLAPISFRYLWIFTNSLGWFSLGFLLLTFSSFIEKVVEKINPGIIPIKNSVNLLLDRVRQSSDVKSFLEYTISNKLITLVPIVLIIIILFWREWSVTSPDVPYYLSLAKNIYHGAGYVDVDRSPQIYRGPVFPMLISLSYFLFGEYFRSALIMERIFWALTVLVSYFLGRSLYNQRTGFLAALFVLSTGVVNRIFYFIWTDGPLVFFTLGFQLLFWEIQKKDRGAKWYVLLGFLLGVSYLLKQTVIVFAPLPFLFWALNSKYRTRQNLMRLFIYMLVIAVFVFGWMGYVYLVGGTANQAAGDFEVGNRIIKEVLQSLYSTGDEQISTNKVITIEKTSPSLIQILKTYYQRDVVKNINPAPVLVIALFYSLYQAIFRKNQADIFLCLSLVLFGILIPEQVRVDYGERLNVYLYCVILIVSAAMFDRFFSKLPQRLSKYMVILTSGLFVFSLASSGIFKDPNVVKATDPRSLDYFTDYANDAAWIDDNISPHETIIMPGREANALHILTTGNRQILLVNLCIGEDSFSPAEQCAPPYISFWIYKGATNPEVYNDFFRGISEPSFIREIQENKVNYVFVPFGYQGLYNYLSAHPDFEELLLLDNFIVFQINQPVKMISNYPSIEWQTCIGKSTPEYLRNLINNFPEEYETKLHEYAEPWMDLSAQDLETFMNWQGCFFEEN